MGGIQEIVAGALSFAAAFGTGFLPGVFRITWLMPRVGPRIAELLELPVMGVVSLLAARWITYRLRVSPAASVRLRMGAYALGWLSIAEVSLVDRLRGLGFRECLETRDPVAGTAYGLALIVFASMPWVLSKRRGVSRGDGFSATANAAHRGTGRDTGTTASGGPPGKDPGSGGNPRRRA